MLRVDSVEGLFGVRAPFAFPGSDTRFSAPDFRAQFSPPGAPGSTGLTPVSGYTSMHNFAPASSRHCEFAHLGSGGVRPLYEARVWLHF